MSETLVIFGLGPVGRSIMEQLTATGRAVTVAQRSRPSDLPALARFVACDAADAEAVKRTTAGASAVICAIGLPYDGAGWVRDWPKIMSNLLAGCEAAGARFVMVDNLYMYGPQTQPLTENLPLTNFGNKPRARAEITRLWQEAHSQGRVRCVAVRASDFYGPGVGQSIMGDTGLRALANGKAATLLGQADLPHDLAYVPDVARATITLLDAPEDAYGQAWHVPCAPILTFRQILQIGADGLGVPPEAEYYPADSVRTAQPLRPHPARI